MALFCPSKTMLLSAALFGLAFAYPELSRPEEADVFLQERGVCYEDDTLLSFEYWRLDSEPYCSSLLGIEDVTSTLLPATSRTTTTTLSEVATTLGTTLTVAQVTVSVTTTSIAGHVGRREKAATITSTVGMQPQPYYAYNPVPSILSYADRHASIASSVYSACSCLHISPKTVSSQTTVQTVRDDTFSRIPHLLTACRHEPSVGFLIELRLRQRSPSGRLRQQSRKPHGRIQITRTLSPTPRRVRQTVVFLYPQAYQSLPSRWSQFTARPLAPACPIRRRHPISHQPPTQPLLHGPPSRHPLPQPLSRPPFLRHSTPPWSSLPPPSPPSSPLAPRSTLAAARPSTTQFTPSPAANNTRSNATAPTAAPSPSASTNLTSSTASKNALL
ncbi:MAG: hypothetical protein Q9179_004927 [Wetmoreana sp. 5 TL-2023]